MLPPLDDFRRIYGNLPTDERAALTARLRPPSLARRLCVPMLLGLACWAAIGLAVWALL